MRDAVGFDALETWAEANRASLVRAALELGSPMISKPNIWEDVQEIEISVEKQQPQLCVSQRGDLMTELAKQIANVVQFPVNTVFLHGLGVVASVLTKSFKIKYGFSDIPANLYVVTAQPPSTGKSAVNGKLYAPVFKAYDKLNESTSAERAQLKREIARLKKELDKEKSRDGGFEEIMDKIADKQARLSQIPEWEGTITDTTIEAAEMVAREQQGMFNIISAEAESINVIVGAVYGDDKGGKKSNQGLVLNAWDGEYVNTKRVGRKGYRGHVRATISVIAQEDSIDTLLAAGASGRGLTERFLMLNEKSLLGERDMFKPYRFDKSLYKRYESLIYNIVMEDEVLLHFDDDADDMIKAYLHSNEDEMREDGKYSNALLTGFMGKADKHIRKIAAVLHCIDEWQDGGRRSNAINGDYATWAIGIFDELAKTFISASDGMGYVGQKSEIEKIRSIICEYAERGKFRTTMSSIRDRVKNSKPFKGSRNLQKKLREEVLPILEHHNYCIVDGANIYINPRLK